ncbi:MAG: hypothetical protein AB7T06_13930 [Kofleriaceae bacterium]
MRRLLLALVLAPSVAHADTVWHVGAGLGLPPGAGLVMDATWRVDDSISVGGHGLVLLDLSRDTLRSLIGPVVTFQAAPRSFVSLGGGYVYDFARTLHTFEGYHTWGASLAFRQGVGETGRTCAGIEINWIPELGVYRDLTVDVGGVGVLLFLGRQGF